MTKQIFYTLLVLFAVVSFQLPKLKLQPKNELQSVKQNLNKFISEFTDEYDTLSNFTGTSVNAFTLDKGEFVWHKKIKFNLKNAPNNIDEQPKNFQIKAYYYKDSSSCSESYMDWMNNFGTYAIPIKIGLNYQDMVTIPILSLKSKKAIIFLAIDCSISERNQKKVKSKCKKIFKKHNFNLMLDSGCGGPVNWKFY